MKKGDFVKAIENRGWVTPGMTGIIIQDSDCSPDYGVRWFGFTKGHTLKNRLKGKQKGSGYYLDADELEQIFPTWRERYELEKE